MPGGKKDFIVRLLKIEGQVHGCVQRAVKDEEGDKIIDELMGVLSKFTD